MRGLPVPGRKVGNSVGRCGKMMENDGRFERNMVKRCQTLRIFDGRNEQNMHFFMGYMLNNGGLVVGMVEMF